MALTARVLRVELSPAFTGNEDHSSNHMFSQTIIIYAAIEVKSDYEVIFERILQELKAKPTALPRTVICYLLQVYSRCCYIYFQVNMSREFT